MQDIIEIYIFDEKKKKKKKKSPNPPPKKTTTAPHSRWDSHLALVVSPRIFHLMLRKTNHDGRNDHTVCIFFHCDAVISCFAKVVGLQSGLLLEKKEDLK